MPLKFKLLKHKAMATAVLALCVVSCSKEAIPAKSSLKEAYDKNNNPLTVDPFLKRYFDESLLSARLASVPWSDSYWPSRQAGIAARWQLGDGFNNYTYKTYSTEQLKKLSSSDLALLSPAEKYDIFQGKAGTYPTVTSVRINNFASAPAWSGLCHGWAPASLNYSEPSPIVLQNADGISIPFGSSDIKALLSYYQGEIARIQASAKGSFVGQPCQNAGVECKGVNAGTFHLALVEKMGRQGQGVILDLSRGQQVWNYPVFGFDMKKILERPAQVPTATNVKEILIEATLFYTVEIAPQWALLGDAGQAVRNATFRYALEFNSRNEVTGGTWLDEQFLPAPEGDHPDFLWTKGRPIFLEEWKPLEQIYEASTAGRIL